MALGKSLGNILDDYFGEQEVSLSSGGENPGFLGMTVDEIAVNKISLSPFQTRTSFDDSKIESLAANIKEHGLIHPIVVLKKTVTNSKDPEYVLLAGERRLRAIKKLKVEKVLAVVKPEKDLTEKQQAMLSAMENLQREDLNPIELGNTFKMLKLTQQIDDAKLSDILGHSVQYVRNYLNLLETCKAVQQALIDGVIGEGQARQLVPLNDIEQMDILKLVVLKDMTVKEIAQLILERKESNKPKLRIISAAHNLPAEIITKADKLASLFPNSKLKCLGDDKKGRIVISWDEKTKK